MDWHNYKKTLNIVKETENHPHSVGERGHLFSSVCFESTEIEYLDLIHSIILSTKPHYVLETGTYAGLSSIAIGFALQQNSKQYSPTHLYTIELDAEKVVKAQNSIVSAGLEQYITTFQGKSVDFILHEYQGEAFSVVFFDSSRSLRAEEFFSLQSKKLLQPGCLLIFHDTSPLRSETLKQQDTVQAEYLKLLAKIAEQCKGSIKFPLSRGLTIMQYGYSRST